MQEVVAVLLVLQGQTSCIETSTIKAAPDKLLSAMTKMTRVENGEVHGANVFISDLLR